MKSKPHQNVFQNFVDMSLHKTILTIIAVLSAIVELGHAQTIKLTYQIEEEQAPMTTIGHIVRDSNIGDFVAPEDIPELRFSFMTQGNPFVSYLWVNATTGELKTFSRIDRETVCALLTSCRFEVEAAVQTQKIGTFFTVISITIDIADVNDNNPTFDPPNFDLQIPEDESLGERFRLPSASDPDKGQGFSVVAYGLSDTSVSAGQDSAFSLVVEGSSSSDFVVYLSLERTLDREKTSSYQFLLEAKDGGSSSLTGTLTVNVDVTDVNDNSPRFEFPSYEANISEITEVGEEILKVKATDLDTRENAKLVYRMPLAQENPVVFSMFAVNSSTGAVRTKTSLDPYAGGSFRFVVEVQDSGTTPLRSMTEVTIHIKDTHNSDPEILLNVFGSKTGVAQVSEIAELGRTVAYVAVTDPDSSLTPNGIVSCSVSGSRFELQATDVDKYKVILTRTLDREKRPEHSLTVLCEDSGSPPLNSSKSFVVEVLDENDNNPVFESKRYTTSVSEGPRKGRTSDVIIQVRAVDADTGANAEISYQFATGHADSDFGIYADGSIVVTNAGGLDREDPVKGQTRHLVVLAVDGGSPPMTGTTKVEVTILDINDNAPQFLEPVYYFNVPEDAELGTLVNNVSATDADAASNGLFYFKMDESDERSEQPPFQVTPEGSIVVSGDLDRETIPEYKFHVIVHDIGQPTLFSSSVLVSVKVRDVNDNPPIFTFPNDRNRTLHIPHTLGVNTGFGKISASDLDLRKNGQLRYFRDSGNGTKYIDILPDTGEIVLIRALTLKDLGPHYVIVAVHDLGSEEQLSTQSLLQIVVYEGNATVAVKGASKGFRNVVVVVVLVVVTVALGLAILLTIILIQRVDKKRRRYHAKEAEAKVDSNLRHLNPVLDMDVMETAADLSEKSSGGGTEDSSRTPDAMGGSSRKKKEVSFSLDEDNSMNNSGSQSSGGRAMTSFGPNAYSDKYDPIPERERGHVKSDLHPLSKKDPMSSFHQVTPMPGSSYSHRQDQAVSHPHDDNLSDVSGDVSTSDSGRGGSDVELQSHGGNSKDSGDPSFHNNLNMGGAGGRNCHNTGSNTGNSNNNMSRNISNSNGSINHNNHHNNSNSNLNHSSRNLGNKSVHFQNIRPEPLSSFRSTSGSGAPPPTHHPTKPPRPLHNSYNHTTTNNNNNYPLSLPHPSSSTTTASTTTATAMYPNAPGRYTPNIYVTSDDEGGSYVKLAANHDSRPSSRPTNDEMDRGHLMTGRHGNINNNNNNNNHHPSYPSSSSSSNQQRYTPTTFYPPTTEDHEYMDMRGGAVARGGSFLPARTSSNPHMDDAGIGGHYACASSTNNSTSGLGWDGDTTTSGSYTVDPHELCDEIDKLFFEEVQDVVV